MRDLIPDEMLEFAAAAGVRVRTPEGLDRAKLATALAAAAGLSRAVFLERFGAHLFALLAARFPVFVTPGQSMLDFLESLEARVHAELRGLGVGLQPPHLECTRLDADALVLVYRSQRDLADLAAGMLAGCSEHFGEAFEVRRSALPGDGGERFELRALAQTEAARAFGS